MKRKEMHTNVEVAEEIIYLLKEEDEVSDHEVVEMRNAMGKHINLHPCYVYDSEYRFTYPKEVIYYNEGLITKGTIMHLLTYAFVGIIIDHNEGRGEADNSSSEEFDRYLSESETAAERLFAEKFSKMQIVAYA